jgi:hypothetical protein
MSNLLLFILFHLIKSTSLEDMHSQHFEISLHLSVPQVILSTVSSGDKYLERPNPTLDSLATYLAGMDVIVKYSIARTPHEIKLLIDLAKDIRHRYSGENQDDSWVVDYIDGYLKHLHEQDPSLKEVPKLSKPKTLRPYTVFTVIAALKNRWHLSYDELNDMLNYINKGNLTSASCQACENYISDILRVLKEKLGKLVDYYNYN